MNDWKKELINLVNKYDANTPEKWNGTTMDDLLDFIQSLLDKQIEEIEEMDTNCSWYEGDKECHGLVKEDVLSKLTMEVK